MAATLVLTSGPGYVEGLKMATYDVVLDTAQATGGEALDFTNEFTYIHAIVPAGNDTAADNAYKYSFVCPDSGTAISSTTVKVQMHWNEADVTTAEDFAEFVGDASAVGNLKVLVIGR